MSLRARIWLGIGIALVGVAVGGGLFIAVFFQINDDVSALHRFGFRADGGVYEVEEPVRATLFVEPQTRSMSGVRYEVIDVASGEVIGLRGAGGSFTYDFPAGSGRSVAAVDLESGEYVVRVQPADATIAIGPSPLPSFGDFLRGVLFGAPLVVIGGTLAVVAAIQQTRSRTREAVSSLPPPGSASPWTTGTWDTDAER